MHGSTLAGWSPMSDFSPHRPEWVRWIPAVVLSILIVSAVITAVIYAPRLAEGPGPAQSGQVDDRNFSVFTEDGLEFIEAERVPRLDLTSTPVEAAPLGLADDGELTVGPHPLDLDYGLVLLVTGEDPQGARFLTQEFTLVTDDGALTEIRIVPSRTIFGGGPFREAAAYLQQQGARYGFAAPTQEEALELVLAAQESGVEEAIETETGTEAGIPISARLACSGGGFCSVTFMAFPPVG